MNESKDMIPAIQPDTLPADTRDKIRATIEAGTSESTKRAYSGDLRQFWRWAGGRGMSESYPVPFSLLLEYITDHQEKHSSATIERRIASLSIAHRLQGFPDQENPSRHGQVRTLLSSAKRAAVKGGKRARKKKAATADVLEALIATCNDSLIGRRDKAILMVGFASGGRRRSELASFLMADLEETALGYSVLLRQSKTDQTGEGSTLPIKGRAANALKDWLSFSGLKTGRIFRAVNKHGQIRESITGHAIGAMVKKRAELAGFDPADFGGHSLRSGFVTEAGRRGIPPAKAQALTGHRSTAVFNGYYEAGDVMNNEAGDMLGMGAL